jgi:hypothetical protein
VSSASTYPAGLRNPRLRDMDGATELAAAEAAAGSRSRPEAVTAMLAAMLDRVDEAPATRESLRGLPSAAREWLLQWVAGRVNPEISWFEARCEHCAAPYDVSIDLSRPAYRDMDGAAATVTVETSLGPRRFAQPTGEHEERFVLLPEGDPRRGFAGLCGLSADAAAEAERFDEHDLELIDEAIEAASPDIADSVSVVCHACEAETRVRIDPLRFAFPREGDVLREIHLVARAYGWALPDILSLKARQRGLCADLIVRERRAGPAAGYGHW